jgi:Polyketide cyclase / dehydrase and lipid transport
MTAVYIIVAIIAIPLVIALFIPKEYSIERSIVIDRPLAEVFEYIKHIKNQDYYSKWVMADPDMHKSFTGTDGEIGFIYAWNSEKKGGEGEQEITGLAEHERITTEIRFVRPFKTVAHTYQTTHSLTHHSTKVVWGMTGHSPYPLNLMTAMLKSGLGKDLDFSLNAMKQNLEH